MAREVTASYSFGEPTQLAPCSVAMSLRWGIHTVRMKLRAHMIRVQVVKLGLADIVDNVPFHHSSEIEARTAARPTGESVASPCIADWDSSRCCNPPCPARKPEDDESGWNTERVQSNLRLAREGAKMQYVNSETAKEFSTRWPG